MPEKHLAPYFLTITQKCFLEEKKYDQKLLKMKRGL